MQYKCPTFACFFCSGRKLIGFLLVGVNHITNIKQMKYLFCWLWYFGHSNKVLVLEGRVFFVLEKHASWNNMS